MMGTATIGMRHVGLTVVAAAWCDVANANMPPYCEMDEGNPALEAYGGYTPYQSIDGFVDLTVHAEDDDDYVIVLQHCASGQQLVAVVRDQDRNRAVVDAVGARYNEMMGAARSYTMGEVRDELNALGARASLSRFTGQSCGCATYGYTRE